MFPVNCPGCKATFSVDERRVPDAGLKMRCPKCQTSFMVMRPGSAPAAAAQVPPAATAAAKPAPPKAPPAPPAPAKPVAPAAHADLPARAMSPNADLPAKVVPGAAKPKTPSRFPSADALLDDISDEQAKEDELGLPLIGGKTPVADLPAAKAAGPKAPGADLPAIRQQPNADLPTAKAAPAAPKIAPPRPAPPAAPAANMGADLPSPAARGPSKNQADLPSPAAPRGQTSPPVVDLPAARVGAGKTAAMPAAGIPKQAAPVADLPSPARPAPPGARPGTAPPQTAPKVGASSLELEEDLLPTRRQDPGKPGAYSADLPAPVEVGLPAPAAGLPVPKPGARSMPKVPTQPPVVAEADSFGDIELSLPVVRAGGPHQAPSAPPPRPEAPTKVSPVMGGALFEDDAELEQYSSRLSSAPAPTQSKSPPGGLELDIGPVHAPPMAAPIPFQLADEPAHKAPSHEDDNPFGLPSAPPPAPHGVVTASAPKAGGTGFGEIDLGVNLGDDGGEVDPFGGSPMMTEPAIPAPPRPMGFHGSAPPEPPAANHSEGLSFSPPIPTATAPKTATSTAAVGGMGWGDRDLGGEPAPPAQSGDDDMEFGAIPQEKSSTASSGDALDVSGPPRVAPTAAGPSGIATAAPLRPRDASANKASNDKADADAKPRGKGMYIAAGVIVLLGLVGGGLTFTPLGPFGYDAIYDALHAQQYENDLLSLQKEGRTAMQSDLAGDANKAVQAAERAHNASPRAAKVAAYGASLIALRDLRFGSDAVALAKAKSWMTTIPEDRTGPPFDLARSLIAATASNGLARGRTGVETALRVSPNDVDILAAAGELNLQLKDAAKALEHFKKLEELEQSARAKFGMVRANMLKGDVDSAEKVAQEMIKANPKHAGARLILAKLLWAKNNDEAAANEALGDLLKQSDLRASAATTEMVEVHVLQGTIHLARSRVSAAEASFSEALKLDGKSAIALAGQGEAFYRASRNTEALGKFKTAGEADPESLQARIGIAKTLIALERLQEAKDLLKNLVKKLKEENKPNSEVTAWLGRAEEALGDKNAAEANYVEAIKLAGTDSSVVDVYVWLAKLLSGMGRDADATARLEEAKNKLPRSAKLARALGEIALTAGRFDDAEREFNGAIALDESDVSLRFQLAVTLRRKGKFDDAAIAFDKVAALDKEYPGLALERAALFDASKQNDKALEMYQAALAKAPNDVDLQLRVAASLLSGDSPATSAQQAEELLRKVFAQRPNSAEANHYMGRTYLVRGINLPEAQKYLRRATEIDPNRAEYFMYVGWVANETDNQQLAATSLDKAIELDRGLADAYWQRGVLKRRQRAVVDAERDLLKAIELRPTRAEARATLAEVYEDQAKWREAESAWNQAIQIKGDRADWRYRFGKLLSINKSKGNALEQLTQAVQLASQMQAHPKWFADANLLLAEAERGAGKKTEAIEHYQKYLQLAPSDSPYRKDAIKGLAALGVK